MWMMHSRLKGLGFSSFISRRKMRNTEEMVANILSKLTFLHMTVLFSTNKKRFSKFPEVREIIVS